MRAIGIRLGTARAALLFRVLQNYLKGQVLVPELKRRLEPDSATEQVSIALDGGSAWSIKSGRDIEKGLSSTSQRRRSNEESDLCPWSLADALLALTSFTSSVPPASAFTCSLPGYPATCCRCLNRCETLYQRCLAEATTTAEELDCFNDVEACDDNCYSGIACGGI
jgi:hypothetical protein